MTEKRFHIINDADNLQKYGIFCKPVVVDNETDKKYILALDLLDLLNKLNEENVRLKQSQARVLRELLIYRKVASCNNCKYQNYDWFEDGDEFEICEKGNSNQQIEYHICKEWRGL